MHCHLDFAPDATALAARADAASAACFANTVTPAAYRAAVKAFAPYPAVHPGLGAHPWHLEGISEDDLAFAVETARSERFIGEVGLDAGRRCRASLRAQVRAFEALAQAAGSTGGHILSVHAVGTAGLALDVLERCGATGSCVCVFHWFSGTSDDLVRARRLGCWFSVGERMLRAKRGRAYLQAIPADRLLLETDWPSAPAEAADFDEWRSMLERAYQGVARMRGTDVAERAQQSALGLLAR